MGVASSHPAADTDSPAALGAANGGNGAAGANGSGPDGAGALPSTATYVAVDLVAVSVAVLVAHLLRFGFTPAEIPGRGIPYVLIAMVAVPVWLGVLTVAGCYDRRILGSGTDEYHRILNGGVHFLAVVAVLHFLFSLVLARGFVGVLIPVAVVLTLLARLRLRVWLYARRRDGRFVRRTLRVGLPSTVVDVGDHLVKAEWSGFRLVGACVDTDVTSLEIAGETVPVVGRIRDVARAIVACGADSVAVTNETAPGDLRVLAEAVDQSGVELLVVPAITDVAGPRTVVRPVAGLPLLHVKEPQFAGPQRLVKDVMDRAIAVVAVVLLSPVFAAVAVAVRLDSQGPVFFRQTRVGRDGRPFKMVKFRTMVANAEQLLATLEDRNEADGLLFKMRDDPRVTRVGRVLRKYSIDELPQLFNAITGEMSLVGPRPPLPNEVVNYEGHVNRRLLVKPGITGLWQVSGRSDLSWDEAIRLDLYYVDHWSPTMDAMIILKTFSAVIRSSGAY
jgi:exopolysaccharide biosynthesis polyprenyl glycosylphosphotransferase